MCISFQISIDPIKVISATWTAIKRPFGYLKHPEAGISRLQNAMDNLDSKRGDLIQRLRSAELAGIWGMGGVRKTTLLQGLNNQLLHSSESPQTPPAFDYVIWTVASKDCNLVKNKSFLFLLDDLWQTADLDEVGIPHPLRSGAGAMKQKVVFTTRLEGVCRQMQARPIMKLDCLGEDEAWQLFYDKVGEETIRAHARISGLARRAVKECDGLLPKEWQNTITMLQKSWWPREMEGMEEKIMMKLKISYDDLTDDIIRKCFLLCCLWLEDHSIPKIDLIQMLKIQNCWTLEVVSMETDGQGSSRSSQKWNPSRLDHMELGNLPALKEIIWRGVMPARMLPSLTVVNIHGCKKLCVHATIWSK
ncbi:putative disease resistance protein [Platanthera zijinensis]|uniref:Disease resistance protein n=1 Tax=Platanthera zijinensis TaxID=2320716 RepID=A0AAP0G0R1_9ASPA